VIREVAKNIHLSPSSSSLMTLIRTKVKGSGISGAESLMRSSGALRQALEREKKKVRRLGGALKEEWISTEEEERSFRFFAYFLCYG